MNTFEKYIEQYALYHSQHQPGRKSGYSGRSILRQLRALRSFSEMIGAKSALDYGCGRGEQYTWTDVKVGRKNVGTVREYLGLSSVALYDPAVPQHAKKPDRRFDLVLCTDVLEHVHENDIAYILQDIASLATKGIYLSIANYKAGTILPNGENAHITIKPLKWWRGQVSIVKQARPELRIRVVVKYKIRLAKKLKITWSRNFEL